MRNEENIGHIVRGERAISSSSLMYNISTPVNSSFINGSKKTHEHKFVFLINN